MLSKTSVIKQNIVLAIYKTFFVILALVMSLNTFSQSDSRLEEVIVTAQKVEEGLSEVPISIQVVSSERLEDIGTTSWEELAAYVPGLQVAKGVQEQSIYMRGVGSGTNKGFEQSVTQFVDNMPVTRSQQYTVPLLDVERVEVLKGTQGVLFGKNTIAGVINTVSKSPEIGGGYDASVSWETVNETRSTKIQAASNIPINENMAMRVALMTSEADGWVKNLFKNGEPEPNTESRAFRTTFLFENDEFAANIKLFKSSYDRVGQHSSLTKWGLAAPPPILQAAGKVPAIAAFTVGSIAYPNIIAGQNFASYQDGTFGTNPNGGTIDSENMIINLSTTRGNIDINWTTSISEYDFTEGADADFTPLSFIGVSGNEQNDATTHELVISSQLNDRFSYIAGFFLEDTEYSFQNEAYVDGTLGNPMILGAVTQQALGLNAQSLMIAMTGGRLTARNAKTHHFHDLTTESQSVFFQGKYDISDKLSTTVGVRYSEDEKSLKDKQVYTSDVTGGHDPVANATLNPLVGAFFMGALGRATYDFPIQTISEDTVTPSFKLDYEYSDTTRLYLSWAEGYKAAGFDGTDNVPAVNYTTPGDGARFEAEEATTTEVGAKMNFPNLNLRANVAAFSTEYINMQVSAFVGASFQVSNAGESTIEGVELDFEWSPVDGLYIGGAISTLDFAFDVFLGSCTVAQEVAFLAASGGAGECTQDMKGKTGVYTPDISSSLYAKYITPINSDVNMILGLDMNKTAEYYSQNDLDPDNLSPETNKVNFRLGLESSDEKYLLTFFIRNLTDEAGRSFGVDLPLISGSHVHYLEPGRQVGASWRVNL